MATIGIDLSLRTCLRGGLHRLGEIDQNRSERETDWAVELQGTGWKSSRPSDNEEHRPKLHWRRGVG